MEISLTGGKAVVFFPYFCGSNHIHETKGKRKPIAKKGRGKWQMKERG